MTNIEIKSKGYYSIKVLDKFGNPVEGKCIEDVSNAVTYNGAVYSLFPVGNNISYIFNQLYCNVGTGVSEITRSSTSLGAEVGSRSSGVYIIRDPSIETDNLDGTSTITATREFAFPLGSKVGTFSEVGVYSASSGGTFIAGQLIKDELGNPTTVTVLSDEQLVVTYTIEWVVPNTSTLIGTGTVTAEDTTEYSYEIWAQPYFWRYATVDNQNVTRYASFFYVGEIAVLASNGTTNIFDSGNFGNGWTMTHDGSGTVTFTTELETFSPASFNTTDLAYLGFYSIDSSGEDLASTSPVLSENNAYCAVYVKFTPPITKTFNDSLTIQVQITITV